MSIRAFLFVVATIQVADSFDSTDHTQASDASSNTNEACEGCVMPMAAQMARLIVANTLTPPYAALEAPLPEVLTVASSWSLDFHGEVSEESALLEALLGDASNRLFLRRVLKRVGDVRSTQILSDCCWRVVAHVCFTSEVHGGNCSDRDADHVLSAKRATGECAIVFQQGNDQSEFDVLEKPEDTFMDFVPFTLRGSDRDVTTYKMLRDEYALATNTTAARDLISSVKSGACNKVFVGVFSFGGMLRQLFRADFGVPNKDGLLTQNCGFGTRTVECSLYIMGALLPFYNSTVESEHGVEDFVFIVEDDLISEMPDVYREGLYCPSCPTDLRVDAFRNVLPYSRIRGMRTFQLRRDLAVALSPVSFSVHGEAVELPPGISMSEWQRNQSYIDRNESYTNGLLGALSHPQCIDPQELIGFGRFRSARSCGHFCLECFFLTDYIFDGRHPDIRIPMPPKSWLFDIYRQAKFPDAAFTEVARDVGNL